MPTFVATTAIETNQFLLNLQKFNIFKRNATNTIILLYLSIQNTIVAIPP